jgi:arachidonate 15-lipoxygenase
MKPVLPQHEPAIERRQTYLKRQQQLYRYSYEYVPPLAYGAELPAEERFSTEYYAKQFGAVSKILLNLATADIGNLFDAFNHLDDYEKLFIGKGLLPKPESINTFLLDTDFARQRIAGANPMVIEQVHTDKLPTLLHKFPITDQILQQTVDTSETLASAAAAGKLYVADYRALADTKGGRYKSWQKFIVAPIALFYWQDSGYSDRGELVPVAIQLGQMHNAQTPLYTPIDEPNWTIAKTFVQVADFNHHELISHLGLVHLLMAPFAIATARTLHASHPLAILLKPHFRFLLAINDFGRSTLVNPGGYIDKFFASSLKGSMSLVVQAILNTDFKDLALPADLKRRGVADATTLPDYPYRDDALLVWGAIKTFVSRYLRLYYKADADIEQDIELQNWVKELVSETGARIRGLTHNNHIKTIDALVDVVTQLLFTCGPQHSAINYPQYDYEAFCPNMPGAAYAAPPTTQTRMTTSDGGDPSEQANFFNWISPYLLKYLPPKRQAVTQIELTYFLTAFRYDRLGYYEPKDFSDPSALAVIKAFQQELGIVENRIDQRNLKRQAPYPFLKPSLITNSISI